VFALDLSPAQRDLLGALVPFASGVVRPAVQGGVPDADAADAIRHHLRRLIGADDGDPVTALVWAEEVSFGDPGVAYDAVIRQSAERVIAVLGSQDQQSKHLVSLRADPTISAGVAYYEGFGRTPGETTTSARRTRGGWLVTGRKIGVLRPNDAQLQVVIVRDEESGRLLSLVLAADAWRAVTVSSDDVEEGKLGLDAAATGNIELNGVLVPLEDALLANAADDLLLHQLLAGLRLQVAAVMVGAGRAALAYAAQYASKRMAFGKPISQLQGVTFPLVDADTGLVAARLQTWQAALEAVRSEDPEAIARLTGQAVAQCQAAALQATRVGVNTLGGHGLMLEHPVERWYRDVGTLAALDFDPLELDLDVF
jgi:alkylation response protein AidB-like acyl-CoA dehydrogenase